MVINIKRVVTLYIIELIILIFLSVIGFYIGPMFIGRSLLNALKNELMSTVSLGPDYIFYHNLVIDTLMAIPIIGPAFFVIALVMTGFILGVYVAYATNSLLFLVISILVTMFLPHGIIELLAYAFSTAGSLTFTRNLLNAIRGKESIGKGSVIMLVIYYAISVLLLFIAANIEYFEIISLKGLLSKLLS
ncbi:MAG: stage II sporulation protein M [Vulcanisaeta sp.]